MFEDFLGIGLPPRVSMFSFRDCCELFEELSVDFLLGFRCSFTTLIQSVGESEHAETLRLCSEIKVCHVGCFDESLVFSSIFYAERLYKNARVLVRCALRVIHPKIDEQ